MAIDPIMETANDNFGQLGASSKHLARRLLTIGENRLELLMVEVQEERERLLHAILLALGVAVFGFLAGVALTVALVVLLWQLSPVAVLLVLTSLYVAIAVYLYRRFIALQRDWKTLPATLDQFKKDRACLENILE
ncbi:MAG: phage holin family protein [Verrucomicrobia bacterium]|nr:MAG: phage holin family protein [Verrucomicrobiota bacterium]